MKDFVLDEKRYKFADEANETWNRVGGALLDNGDLIDLWHDVQDNWVYYRYTLAEPEMTHEEKMQKAWQFIEEMSITDDETEYKEHPDSYWLVDDVKDVRDAYYSDLENGLDDIDESLSDFFERHNIDYK